MAERIGIAMVGYSFMGKAHSQAWRNVHRFFSLPLEPTMKVVVGRNAEAVEAAAETLGWEESSTDWRTTIQRDDIGLVDICTPGDSHAEIAIEALKAGKHVLCEKPMANSVEQAQVMTDVAQDAWNRSGAIAMVGFTYRRIPAIQLARKLVADGRIGRIYHVRAQYLQDWIADPGAPLSWRLDKSKAGSGALGDIGAHIVDLTQFITGETIQKVSGVLRTFVDERPVQTAFSGLKGTAGEEMGPVTVDDAAVFMADFSGGALGTFEATRFAYGRKNAIRIEINGSKGSLAFDFEDMNLLHYFDATEPPATAGFRRIVVTEPEHEYVEAWWPAGHLLGYEHAFSNQAADLLTGIANRELVPPTFADGLQVQKVLAAVETSSSEGSWVIVD